MPVPDVKYDPKEWIMLHSPDGYRWVRPSAISEIWVLGDSPTEWEIVVGGEGYCVSEAIAKEILARGI